MSYHALATSAARSKGGWPKPAKTFARWLSVKVIDSQKSPEKALAFEVIGGKNRSLREEDVCCEAGCMMRSSYKNPAKSHASVDRSLSRDTGLEWSQK